MPMTSPTSSVPTKAKLNLQLRELTRTDHPDIQAVMSLLDTLDPPSPEAMVTQLLKGKAVERPSALWEGRFDVQTLDYLDRLFDKLS